VLVRLSPAWSTVIVPQRSPDWEPFGAAATVNVGGLAVLSTVLVTS